MTRLRSKIVHTVIMLSHTREKMKYIETLNGRNSKELASLNQQLDETKDQLTKLKGQRAVLDKANQKLSQKTGIARDNSLKEAYELRKNEFHTLHQENEMLAHKHAELSRIIKEARQIEQAALMLSLIHI